MQHSSKFCDKNAFSSILHYVNLYVLQMASVNSRDTGVGLEMTVSTVGNNIMTALAHLTGRLRLAQIGSDLKAPGWSRRQDQPKSCPVTDQVGQGTPNLRKDDARL